MRKYLIFYVFLCAILFSILKCSSTDAVSTEKIKTSPPSKSNIVKTEEKLQKDKEEDKRTKETQPQDIPSKDVSQVITPQQEYNEEEASSLLEEAMDVYQDAQHAWERGDFDTAITALDEAYSLILKVKLPPDSPLLQEKDDLRLLIAKRIQEIYASRLVTAGDNNRTIPLIENKHVLKEIKSFQTKERKFFIEAYKRSGKYRDIILRELQKAGLPEQLSWLPLIESGFKVRALSRARALGLWQFISSTGYRFGLKRDRWVDERMDPIKSTRAAIKYLTELHSIFGDWTTALAAYNCGEIRVQKVIKTQRINYLDNFWDLYVNLPYETARFVPRFIAALLIIQNPEKYGFELPEPDPPLKYELVSVNRPVKLSSLAKAIGVRTEELVELNPELRHNSTPDYDYLLKVPVGFGDKVLAKINSIPRYIPPQATYIVHYVRRGETLSTIAKRYRTSVRAIARLNRLRRINLIRPGQRLKIPVRGTYIPSYRTYRPKYKLGEKVIYTVRRGDSLYRIARMFNTTISRIKKDNRLKSNVIKVGQKLVINSGKPKDAIVYKVKSGDTPYDIAKKFGMSLSELLSLNGLTSRSRIYPGQELWVIPKKLP
ncbi:LysM peptidoglycan-binding domain-containing protein [Candidatus Aminicenantes bacterium AC-708-M15]|jgi:membrane-bound lytic murein transglycosylase D|nr:LysM peptidoglycan-binding domain-containing protein [SCandidatus Aminicenantes bacterium Aminicenantia_JdfR_composite]MCP2596657.1 LysM peptidoglycan-binding domain-containing protein [Candidatus Aminicenantes bacterium AC-335-G13]MCP2598228.1 LysM peptidoglycan-binding domain-containing protein [Candidatus Aminicenantes bacterium AC-335-L06]MCP2603939.1 LysM peptidoglycan-binding domain-containing protein [Candidatus Aminicenantes bacterium AC-708-M15]MCP2606354.1 LysM peptidoglycan-bindin